MTDAEEMLIIKKHSTAEEWKQYGIFTSWLANLRVRCKLQESMGLSLVAAERLMNSI